MAGGKSCAIAKRESIERWGKGDDVSMTRAELQETHWHKQHGEAWGEVMAAVPGSARTEFDLWALRVDRVNAHKQTVHVPHKYLMTVECSRYAKREDGVFAAVVPEERLTFLCVVDHGPNSRDVVKRQLSAHGYNPNEWSMASCCGPLVLTD